MTSARMPVLDLDPIEETALLQVVWRAVETASPTAEPWDPFAQAVVAQAGGAALIARFTTGPDLYRRLHVAAVRVADGRLRAWGAEGEDRRQVVLLASGLDGRMAREVFSQGTSVFAVDRPRILDLYRRLSPPGMACPVPVPGNLVRPAEVLAALRAAGWRADRPTAFVAEGVMEFLGGAAMARLLGECAGAAAPGSLLLVQSLDPALVDRARAIGDTAFPWRRLPDPLSAFAHLPVEDVQTLSVTPQPGVGEIEADREPEPLTHVLALPL
ncbi:class I SAM-dependent methyltransferase [Rhodospirillum sp. A1_3_36]|uniref:class I SAM-dependent methyltransferase n=1 Tax=Rhodospirillum sp. A1_3_36 TaxID=3391666 RepID=UPI0039A4A347